MWVWTHSFQVSSCISPSANTFQNKRIKKLTTQQRVLGCTGPGDCRSLWRPKCRGWRRNDVSALLQGAVCADCILTGSMRTRQNWFAFNFSRTLRTRDVRVGLHNCLETGHGHLSQRMWMFVEHKRVACQKRLSNRFPTEQVVQLGAEITAAWTEFGASAAAAAFTGWDGASAVKFPRGVLARCAEWIDDLPWL